MIKKIVVPLDLSESTRAAARVACLLARETGAVIQGLSILDLDAIEDTTAAMGIGSAAFARQAREDMLKEEKQEAREARLGFEALCQAQGVEVVEHEITGATVEAILDTLNYADLMVVGSQYLPVDGPEETESLIRDVLLAGSRPILMVGSRETSHLGPVVVAWDGSKSAARALQSFVCMMPPKLAGKVTVVSLFDSEKEQAEVTRRAEAAADFLRLRGFEAEALVQAGPAKARLPLIASELGALTVVLGAYGHTRITDLLFGSLSRILVDSGVFHLFLDR